MHFVPHWARARVNLEGTPDADGPLVAFGWSKVSAAAAEHHALERARSNAERLRNLIARRPGAELGPTRPYYCVGDRPMREPIVEELRRGDECVGVITRNGYGCYVLNTTRAMFIDIDLPKPKPVKRVGLVQRILGAVPPPPPTRGEREEPVLGRIHRVMQNHPKVGMRLYRTKNGFRGLVTTETFEPTSDAAMNLMTELASDPLYMTLCRTQNCFRARLTPKPWRLGISAAPHSFFPWKNDPAGKRAFDAWDAAYESLRHEHAVCEEVSDIGPQAIHADVEAVFELHRKWTCTEVRRARNGESILL